MRLKRTFGAFPSTPVSKSQIEALSGDTSTIKRLKTMQVRVLLSFPQNDMAKLADALDQKPHEIFPSIFCGVTQDFRANFSRFIEAIVGVTSGVLSSILTRRLWYRGVVRGYFGRAIALSAIGCGFNSHTDGSLSVSLIFYL